MEGYEIKEKDYEIRVRKRKSTAWDAGEYGVCKMFFHLAMRLIEQIGIQYCHGSHGLYNGHGTRNHAGVVATLCLEGNFMALHVYGLLVAQQGGHGFKSYSEVDVLAIADAALNASAMIRRCRYDTVMTDKGVVELAAPPGGSSKALTILKALYGIDAQHGTAQHGMQLIKFGLTKTYRTTFDDACHHTTHRVALFLHAKDELFHAPGYLAVRTAHSILLYLGEVIMGIIKRQCDVAHLRGIGLKSDAQLAKCQLSQGASHYTSYCNAG